MDKNSPAGRAASQMAIDAMIRRDKRNPFYDEDEAIEYRRELEREIYDDMMERYEERNGW